MRYFSISIFFFVLCSCGTNSRWAEFSADGLPSKGESYKDIVFVNKDTGFLGGERFMSNDDEGGTAQFQRTAVLYQTTNQGKAWHQIPLHYKGSVKRILTFGDTLVLVVQDITSDSNYLVRSADAGKNWEELLAYPPDTDILDLSFESAGQGTLILASRIKKYLLTLTDGRWDTLLTFNANELPYQLVANKVISLVAVPNTADFSGYAVIDPQTHKRREVHFDRPYFIASNTKAGRNLYLAVSSGKEGGILKLREDGYEAINLSSYASYEPDEIFVHGNLMMAIGNQQKDVGPFFVSHHFLVSDDGGKTWSKETLPDELYVRPATLFEDQLFITYSGTGRFQVRK